MRLSYFNTLLRYSGGSERLSRRLSASGQGGGSVGLTFLSALVFTVFSVIVLFIASPARAEDPVTLEKSKPTIEYKTFDPKNPAGVPDLETEQAICLYRFNVTADLRYGYSASPRPEKGPVKLPVKITGVSVNLSLTITIYLPTDATDALKAHEEAHRTIAEHYYKDADAIAKTAAKKLIGQTFTGEGKDAATAADNAVSGVSRKLCDQILNTLATPCDKAQEHFDKITDHGRKSSPTVEEAIKAAIAAAKK